MKQRLLLGYDIGSSSIKASFLNADIGAIAASACSPETELKIQAPGKGLAEQNPELWWEHIINATKKLLTQTAGTSYEVLAIGISYQMHGLVTVDRNNNILRPAIIWCDSRAVEIGNRALRSIGEEYCLSTLLNSPGNFTASKLKWVQEYEPDIYRKIHKYMLPGDYIAFKLTDEICTTVSGLSEGIFWNFRDKEISDVILQEYAINPEVVPTVVSTFGTQGVLTNTAAEALGLTAGIPVAYRAGDQPNNALSLNVLNTGEFAATAGTSGVIYGVADTNIYDPHSRVNTFAHVNYTPERPNVGVLLCINGTGIQYSWLKQAILENRHSYSELNTSAAAVEIGSNGVRCFPFGNGAERVLKNVDIKAHFSGINFNVHSKDTLVRAAQEGIAFAFRFGLDIMRSIGMNVRVIRAGSANLFQSEVFKTAFVNTCDVELELYNTDGSLGAARGAGIGAGLFSEQSAFKNLSVIVKQSPNTAMQEKYHAVYETWKIELDSIISRGGLE